MVHEHDLWRIVTEYAAFGDHHTGTAADVATTEWLVGLLDQMGAAPTLDPFEFDRFVVTAALTVESEPVPTVPVFYSQVGSVDTGDLALVQAMQRASGSPTGIDTALAEGSESQAVVLTLDGPDDLPVQCNRVPTELGGRPAVIAPGNWRDRLHEAISSDKARLRFDASLEPGRSANVLATFGSPSAPAVTVTTPLTGWTPAAGERAGGLAAALAIAADLADDHHVQFVACTGHELAHLGLHRYLDTTGRLGPTIHLGASVAAVDWVDDAATLAESRMVLCSGAPAVADTIARAVTRANWTLTDLDQPWPGEGGTWLEAGADSVLSFLGATDLFHTSGDLPDIATTPEAVALAAEVAVEASRVFCDAVAG